MKCKHMVLIVLFMLFLVVPSAISENSQKNVLILHSYHSGYKWTDEVHEGILEILDSYKGNLNIHTEYMDTKKIYADNYMTALPKIYASKYSNTNFDLIIASDDNAFNFLKKHHEKLFPRTPVVVTGANWLQEDDLNKFLLFTGVSEQADVKENIETILKLRPNTTRIIAIADDTTTGKKTKAQLRDAQEGVDVEIEILSNITMQELETRLRSTKKNDAVLLTVFFKDSNGDYFEYNTQAKRIAEASNAPVFGQWSFSLANGVVGGYMTSGRLEGEKAGELGLMILNGENLTDIQPVIETQARYMFDYQALIKHNIRISDLPNGSKLINDEYSRVLKSAAEFDYPPFSLVKNGSADGFSVQLLRAALNSTGHKVEFKVGYWNNIKQELSLGRLDVLPLVARTKEREEMFDFTVPYITMRGAVFARDNRSITDVEDLKDMELIVMQGDSASEYATRNNISDKIVFVESYEKAFVKLSSGKHDAILCQKIVGEQLIQEIGIDNVSPVFPVDGFKQDFTFAVEEGDYELLSILNEGLSKIISEGTYDKIYDDWLEGTSAKEPMPGKTGVSEISIRQKAQAVAHEVNNYLKEKPNSTIEDLQRSKKFKNIAVQKVGKYGYTALIDAKTGTILLHPQDRLVNTDSQLLSKEMPQFWEIFNSTIGEKCTASSGYYNWKESDDTRNYKYMYTTCIDRKTAKGRELFAVATTYVNKSAGEKYVDYYNIREFKYAKEAIIQKAKDVAKQVEIYLRSNPDMTVEELQNDSYFADIAVQKVGTTGYTSITDQDTSEQYFHPDSKMVGEELASFKEQIPELWEFFSTELLGKCNEAGVYYLWPDENGTLRQKYAYSVCIPTKTADGKRLGVDASTYIDEYETPSTGQFNLHDGTTNPSIEEFTQTINLNWKYITLVLIAVFLNLFLIVSMKNKKITRLFKNFLFLLITSTLLLFAYIVHLSIDNQIGTTAEMITYFLSFFYVFLLVHIFADIGKTNISGKSRILSYIYAVLIAFLVLTIHQSKLAYFHIMIVLALTPLIIFLLYLVFKNHRNVLFLFAYLMLILITIANMLFYVVFNFSQPYLLLLTPIILNLVLGFLLYKEGFLAYRNNTIIISIAGVLVLIIGLFIFSTYQSTLNIKEIDMNTIGSQLEAVSKSKKEHISTYLDSEKTHIEELSKLPTWSDFLNGNNSISRIEAREMMGSFLEDGRAFLINSTGQIELSTDESLQGKNMKKSSYWRKGLYKPFISELFRDNDTGQVLMGFSAPITGKHSEVLGLLVKENTPEKLFSITTDNAGLGETGETYLVNQDGLFLTPSRLKDDALLKDKVNTTNSRACSLHESLSIQEIKAKHSKVHIFKDYLNNSVLGTHKLIHEKGWCLLAEINVDEATADVDSSISKMWLSTIGIIFAVIIIGALSNLIFTGTLRREVSLKTKELNKKLHKEYKTSMEMAELLKKKKETEKELKSSEERLKSFFQSNNDMVFVKDSKFRYLIINKAFENLLGKKEKEIKGKKDIDLLPAGLAKITQKNDRIAIKRKNPTTEEIKFKGMYLECTKFPVMLEDGKYGIGGIVRDITQRKANELALKESEEKFQSIVEGISDIAYTTDSKGLVTYISPVSEKIIGYTPEEILGKSYENFIFSEDLDYVRKEYKNLFKGKTSAIEHRIVARSGQIIWVRNLGSVSKIGDNHIMSGIMSDITVRKAAEESLKVNENKFRSLFEQLNDAAIIHNLKGDIIDVNERTCELLEYEKEELLRLNLIDIHPDDELHKGKEFLEQTKETGYAKFESKLLSRTGKVIPVLISSRMPDMNNDIVNALVRDITKEKQAEEEMKNLNTKLEKRVEERTKKLKQANEKVRALLKTKSEFVNQVAHDLRTPLTPIMGLIPIVGNDIKTKKNKELFEVIKNNAKLLNDLVVDTLNIARLDSGKIEFNLEKQDLNEIVSFILKNNKENMKDVKIENKISKGKYYVLADRTRIIEVLENLINNSLKFMEKDKKLVFSAKRKKQAIEVSVTDNGMGMTKEQLKHVFDEFYKGDASRHESAGSSGLGLSICRRIIENHDGKIWAESDGAGKGTTISFTLPEWREENGRED